HCAVRTMFLPDRFVAHGSQQDQYADAGLMAGDIMAEAQGALAQARPRSGAAQKTGRQHA
ncbi:MAG TPA: hypothetical protein PKE19_11080, partial [Aestuariivirga sp.]|nr:hypothetical protein [Aestuariivirga sp.]